MSKLYGSKGIGHITKSRVWLSVERRPAVIEPDRWISFGKTYNGTIAGVVAKLGRYVLIGHIRERDNA